MKSFYFVAFVCALLHLVRVDGAEETINFGKSKNYNSDDLINKLHVRKRSPCFTQRDADWGLERTSEIHFTNSRRYTYSAQYQGQGVDVYVIDTGVYEQHTDFEGRAKQVKDFLHDDLSRPDEDGHGTLIASLIIGKKYGVAKKARVAAVRVFNNDGEATIATIVKSIQWVANEARKKGRTVILNASFGPDRNRRIDFATRDAIKAGVAVVTSAGNEGKLACKSSPAGYPSTITVAGSDREDKFLNTRRATSNWGSCVDIFAPSENLLGAGIGSPYATKKDTGTSFGTALVSGILARLLSQYPTKTPAQLKQDLIAMASNGLLKPVDRFPWPDKTVNRLVYMGCP